MPKTQRKVTAVNTVFTFDFLRQTMSLLSPTTLMIIVLSFFTFLSEDKWGSSSFQYKALTFLSALVWIVITIAIFVDFWAKSKGHGALAWIANSIILAFFIVFIGMILYYAVINAATLYSAIYINIGEK
jgi:hypothetical protein